MYEFHLDRKKYFETQTLNAAQYVIPFIEAKKKMLPGTRVLEIGCGEGGVLQAFLNCGCNGVGVELYEPKAELAREMMQEYIAAGRLRIISRDIYQVDIEKDFGELFDIIVLKDVIEHIHDQEKLIGWMKKFLKPGGVIFFGFPPWYMPFGGHQQMCNSKLSRTPYIHLLPRSWYKWVLEKNKEGVADLLEIYDTGISIERFEKICKKTGYNIIHYTPYLINPIYKWKFGWKPRQQLAIVAAIPFIRNFFTTCVYYLISPKQIIE